MSQCKCRQKDYLSTYNTPDKYSVVYDDYWEFAQERQTILYKKMLRIPGPWTDDIIIKNYKFTNSYRATDRVSQYLIRSVIYAEKEFSPEDTLFRILLFKMFNKIETWEYLEQSLGEISYKTYSYLLYDRLLTRLMSNKICIYSGAYILPSGKSAFGSKVKHRNNLQLLEMMMSSKLSKHIAEAESLKELFEILLSYPTLGRFLAFQYAIDINYSDLTDFDEMSFVVAGPGAERGIRKCFPDRQGVSAESIIKEVADRQDWEFLQRGIDFHSLNGRPLQLIDCQNLFCEIDKYSRVAHPGMFDSNRVRIKQKYKHTNLPPIDFFFPPKWGINQGFKQFVEGCCNVFL
jgi:hypothetical protein